MSSARASRRPARASKQSCVLRLRVLKLHRSSCLKASGKMHFWEPEKCIFAGALDNALPKASSQQQELSRTRFQPSFAYDRHETRKCIFRRRQNAFLQAPKDTHCSQNKCVYLSSQNALRHLARENASAQTMLPKRTDPANAGCGPSFTVYVGCRETPRNAQPQRLL